MNFVHSSLRAGNAGIACARRDSAVGDLRADERHAGEDLALRVDDEARGARRAAPVNDAPAVADVGRSTAFAAVPASIAEASVWPAAATCGSVKITRDDSGPSIFDTGVLVAEDAIGGHARLVLAHVRQQCPAVDVADGVEPFVAGHAHPVVVDVDRAPRLQADRLQAELGGVWPAPDRDEQPIAGDDAAIFKFDSNVSEPLVRNGAGLRTVVPVFVITSSPVRIA